MMAITIPGPLRLSALRQLPATLVGSARRAPVLPAGRGPRIVVGVVLAALAIGSGTVAVLDTVQRVPAGSAFRVAGDTTSVQQLDDRVRLLGALYGIQAPADPAGVDTFRRSSAKALAISEVIDRAAGAEGIVIADKAANDELTRVVQSSFPIGRTGFTTQLARLGITEQDVLAEVKRQLANAQLYDKVTGGVPLPTDDEVAAAYTARQAAMVTPEQRHLRNIVVASEGEAKALRARLDGGVDFATVAQSTSLDQATKAKGGDLGTVAKDQMEPDYAAAAFGTAANGLFGPVRTRYGWNIGQTLEVTPSTPLTLDQVRDPLRTRLADERKSAVWSDWLSARIADADVRYADDYRPADPLAAPTVPAP